jgi:nucleoside-diphosphate-sugar epimerase
MEFYRVRKAVAMTIEKAKILVTGANGFLGTRLVEFLALAYRADVRALVRDLGRSVRLCRLPVEIALGDVRDERAIERAIDGCSIVVHCASGIDARTPHASSTFSGTQIVARAALLHKVQRLVHISSAAVYGSPGAVEVNENYPLSPRWKNDVYGAAKIAGEHLVHKFFLGGLPSTIIQPTIIYGPYSAEWSIHPLETLRTSNYVLPKGGLLSPVYVDDVVRAIILAATRTEAVGQRYIVSGSETIDWVSFYEAYAKMGVKGRVLPASADAYWKLVKQHKSRTGLTDLARLIVRQPEIRTAAKNNSFVMWSYRWAKRLVSDKHLSRLKGTHLRGGATLSCRTNDLPVAAFLPAAGLWELYKSPSRYSIEKVKHELGYRPQIELQKGMELTAEWARWVRLVERARVAANEHILTALCS